ncbi:MAG: hypothetical protein ACFBWO_01245 [Paracoccaceae bacterium]
MILRSSAPAQAAITALALATLPLGYAVLAATKALVDMIGGATAATAGNLAAGVALGLGALALHGGLKYALALLRVRTAERMRRRLRLMHLRRVDPAARQGLGPALSQEVEIVGGLAGELVATPLVQLGTIAAALVFLASEHPALALASALAALGNIVALRPLQRRAAALARERVALVRGLNADLIGAAPVRRIVADCTALERVRLRHARVKFLTKLTANLMIGTTPLALIGLGGWLALAGHVSVGGVVAAVIASREIGPSVRALVAFEQTRLDAGARYVAMRERWSARLA